MNLLSEWTIFNLQYYISVFLGIIIVNLVVDIIQRREGEK